MMTKPLAYKIFGSRYSTLASSLGFICVGDQPPTAAVTRVHRERQKQERFLHGYEEF